MAAIFLLETSFFHDAAAGKERSKVTLSPIYLTFSFLSIEKIFIK